MHPPLPDIIHRALLADRREPTGKLHCSSHSHWPLRFTQLSQVFGEAENDFGSLITMQLGTLTHKWLESRIMEHLGDGWEMAGTEIDLTDCLPERWTGTCDYLFFHRPSRTYAVSDLKTAKPESLAYLNGEPKREHWIQVSCYHAALVSEYATAKLDPDISVVYLPKGKTAKQENVLPILVSKKAIPKQKIFDRLDSISAAVDGYVEEYRRTGRYDNIRLAAMPLPEPKVSWNRAQNVWDVTLRPSWTEQYIGAQFGPELCPPTPSTKIGHWSLDGYFVARKGYGYDGEIPSPSAEEMKRRG